MATMTITGTTSFIYRQPTTPSPTPALPPQTTPFTPSSGPEACELSVYCRYLSQYAYQTIQAHGGHPLAGQQCEAAHTMPLFGGSVVAHISRCFPEGYFNIFNTLGLRLTKQVAHHEGDEATFDSTLAYPGSACISGWTTACTTAITHEGDTYSQAWCCPPGSWTCAIFSPGQDNNNSGRRCVSLLTGRTEIWLTWDPPFTSQDLYEWYTWPTWIASEAVQDAATVWHDVFPLQSAMSRLDAAVQPTTLGNRSSIAFNIARSSPSYADAPISTMASTTAAAVAAVVVLGPLAALLVFIVRIRHQSKAVILDATTAVSSPDRSNKVSPNTKLGLEYVSTA